MRIPYQLEAKINIKCVYDFAMWTAFNSEMRIRGAFERFPSGFLGQFDVSEIANTRKWNSAWSWGNYPD